MTRAEDIVEGRGGGGGTLLEEEQPGTRLLSPPGEAGEKAHERERTV